MSKEKKESEVERLKKDIQEKEKQLKEHIETLQRLQAEFENYSKRVEKDNCDYKKYAKGELIKKILPTLDSFELALKNHQDKEKFMKGMEMIYAQLWQTLEEEGLRKIESVGKKFDPFFHEVLMTERDNKKEDDEIAEELQKGYMLNDKVLRYSKVKVNKMEENKNENKG